MSSNETAAYEIMKSLDVDYVLIIFGGVIGYSGDDINKFLWMVRIAEGEHPRDIRVRRKLNRPCRADAKWKSYECLTCCQKPRVEVVSLKYEFKSRIKAHSFLCFRLRRKVITSPRRESSGWTKPALPRCSTA